MNQLITLIHGTFAKDAPWTQPGSEFRQELQTRIQGEILFESFSWSAKNSHDARIAASVELAAILRSQITEFPVVPKTIIAHSHGGNIALYALKLLGDEALQFRVVTLSTPFLNSQKRQFESKTFIYSEMLIALMCITRALILCYLICGIWYLFQPFDKDHAPVGLLKPLMAVPILVWIYKKRLEEQFKKEAEKLPAHVADILEKVSLTSLRDIRILAIIDNADEVRRIFTFAAPLWEYLIRLHNLILYMVGKLLYLAGGALALGLIVSAIYGRTTPPGPHNLMNILGMIIGVGICGFLFVPFFGIALSSLFYLIKSNKLFLGAESQEHQLLIRTTPSLLPFEFKNVRTITHQVKRNGFSWKHSIYKYDGVIPEIAAWIAEEDVIRAYLRAKDPRI